MGTREALVPKIQSLPLPHWAVGGGPKWGSHLISSPYLCQVAGVRFAFDPSQPPGSRVNPRFVQIQDSYLDLNKNDYRLATKAYLAMGKDG